MSLLRRALAYSLGSVVAATCGETAFVVVYGVAGLGTAAGSLAGFVGGAVPNRIVNRRWVWGDRRGRRLRTERTLYWAVAIGSFVASVAATDAAEAAAGGLTTVHAWRVALVAAAYLAVSGVFFVAKFVLFHLVVFRAAAPPTTS